MSSILSVGGAGNVGGGSFYPYSIDQSLRFNDNDSAYLSRTPASAGNRKTWTWSGWLKRGNIIRSSHFPLFGAHSDGSNNEYLYFRYTSSEGELFWRQEVSGASVGVENSLATFRDPSAWYHIVFAYDSSNATSTDRIKIYVNGVRLDLDNANPTELNRDSFINNSVAQYIGYSDETSSYFDGYMAEVNFIDGTALDPTSFGETINGIWVPKAYSGSYGTNGFYLPFDDSAAIGDDESGNANDWTANNLAASDVVPDSPTNNWSTLNYLHGAGALTEGNLRQDGASSDWGTRGSTFTVSSGKWYFEGRTVDGTTTQGIMFGASRRLNIPSGEHVGENSVDYSFYTFNGDTYNNNSASAYGSTFADGDICGIALDLDAGTLTFYKNGTTMGVAFSSLPSGDYTLYGSAYGTATYQANFGQDSTFAGNETAGGNADANGVGDFFYAPPSGFLALCSANLPEPTISPNAAEQADDYFNTVLYTGNSGTGSPSTQAITGVGFETDFLWVKDRTSARNHILIDSIRGDSTFLISNLTNAEATNADVVASLDTDGFTVGNAATCNFLNNSYVAWNWKAGGTAVSNTDGSITSSVSAAPDAGFSIVSYTGTGANATVGHGLASAPEMVIVKERTSTSGWFVYTSPTGAGSYLNLHSTAASSSSTTTWNNTAPTSSVFSVGTSGGTNESSQDYIAYCFHSSDICKVGSYVGNGSTDGTFVYTGFRPAWIMTKETSDTSSWNIYDNKRSDDNPATKALLANSSNAEGTGTDIDILSSGFKIRSTSGNINTSGNTYIYLAFAEAPFKYANAR